MNITPSPSGHLSHLGLLRFQGADAASFLQGQVSQDTRRLTAGASLLAAYSSPQGRVLALLHLLPHSSGILALLPRELVAPTSERLRKFVMRAKVTITDLSDEWVVVGAHSAAALAAADLRVPDPLLGYVEQNGIAIAAVGPRFTASPQVERFWVVGTAAALAERRGFSNPPVAAIETAWRLADIRAGLPQVYAATSEQFVAQMLNLDLLDGISFTKGCYTGQEIIARTQHLGRIKRRLCHLRLPLGTWALGQALTLSDGRTGRITEFAAVDGAVEALAVLTLAESASPPSDALDAAAVTAAELPLPYPLNSAG